MRQKTCSGCHDEGYCSPECQKDDWKIHKLMCAHMKSDGNLLPYTEVDSAISKLKEKAKSKEGTNSEKRLLEYCLSFAEQQYGPRIANKSYRERDGVSVDVRVDNWHVDINRLFDLCFDLGTACGNSEGDQINMSDLGKDCCEKAIHFYEETLSLLKPWQIQIDLKADERTDSIDEVQMNYISERTSSTERWLGQCYSNQSNYDKAGVCYDRAILYGRRVGD
jgi:tetratricopeptide (TPR) repeat protein